MLFLWIQVFFSFYGSLFNSRKNDLSAYSMLGKDYLLMISSKNEANISKTNLCHVLSHHVFLSSYNLLLKRNLLHMDTFRVQISSFIFYVPEKYKTPLYR